MFWVTRGAKLYEWSLDRLSRSWPGPGPWTRMGEDSAI